MVDDPHTEYDYSGHDARVDSTSLVIYRAFGEIQISREGMSMEGKDFHH
jgi:hypothetical protein